MLVAALALDGIGPEHVADADDSHTNRDGGQPKEDVEAINPCNNVLVGQLVSNLCGCNDDMRAQARKK